MTSLLSPKRVISVSDETRGVEDSTGSSRRYEARWFAANGHLCGDSRIPHGFLAISSGSSWVMVMPKTRARTRGLMELAALRVVKST
jgi:hypothetical protein